MRHIFKNRRVETGDGFAMEYLIFNDQGRVIERFACQPSQAQALTEQHKLNRVSFADCRRNGWL